MAEKRDYSIGEVYQGGYSTLDPKKNEYFTGYNATAGSIGLTTNPQATFKLSSDFSTKLSSGVKHMELALVSPKFFDNTPKQELKEVTRLAKLTGSEVSVHAPVMDSAGMSRDGWSESYREMAETKITDYIDRSHEVNPTGNTTVVFHTSDGIPASTWETLGNENEKRKAKKLLVIDRESGRGIIPLEKETLYYPDLAELKEETISKLNSGTLKPEQITPQHYKKTNLAEGTTFSPERRLQSQNRTQWDNEMKKILFEAEAAEKTLRMVNPIFREKYALLRSKNLDPSTLSSSEMEEIKKVHFAAEHIEEASLHLKNSFSKAYKLFKEDGNQEAMNELTRLSDSYKNNLGINDPKSLRSFDPQIQSNAITNFVDTLSGIIPTQFVSLEEFATEKSSQTFGNAAFNAYDKLGDKTPIIAIENPPATEFALSTGEDLRNLVVASRKQFAKRLVSEKGIGKKEADKIAEKHIGATWDVGHINMLRAQGFNEKDIIKESEKIAPYLKHVHLSDNFGLEHTELPMGMGNVPMKEIMEKLGQKGFEAKKIAEAGEWWQIMQKPPIVESFEGLGSPIYTDGVGPFWNQTAGFQQGYMGGYGQMLPTTHFTQLYGAGFSSVSLPKELGGRVGGGAGGRMGGGRE
ncbi:MAG: sugar phosphate isomerase/epimerase [Nanoarchaeota archaeon]|nr:sugar phosphate isomerase/epimerase [Nanoarchaeota archaeon]